MIAAALAGCAAIAGTARADEVGLVIHATAGASPSSADEVAAALGAAARADGWTVEPRPLSRAEAAVREGAVPAERLARFAEVEQVARDGWRAYLEARPTLAASRLGEARAVAAELLDVDGGPELYGDLSLRLGAVELALGRGEDAERDFRLAAALDPERAVTDAEFKPEVVERAAAARAAAPPRVVRRIEAVPRGAAIEVDGRAMGQAPLEHELEVGLHVVVARAPGYAARAETVAVVASDAGAIVLRLDEDPDAAAALGGRRALRVGRGEEDATRAAEALMLYGDLDAVLILASVWRRGEAALLGQLCRGRPLRCGRVVEIGHPRARLEQAAARLWREVQAAPRRFPLTMLGDARMTDREPAPGERPVHGGDTRRRWWRSGWLWLGVGSAALAVAAGIVLTTAGDDEAEPVVVLDPCEFGGC